MIRVVANIIVSIQHTYRETFFDFVTYKFSIFLQHFKCHPKLNCQ